MCFVRKLLFQPSADEDQELEAGSVRQVVHDVFLFGGVHVLDRHAGVFHLGTPGLELAVKFLGDVGVIRNEVLVLVFLAAEIEEELLVASVEVFPLALTHGGLAPEAPEEDLMWGFLSFAREVRNEADAIEGLGLVESCQGHGGGTDVERADGMVEGLSGGDGAGPGDDIGERIPPSVSMPFSPTQGSLREPSQPGPLPGSSFM